MPSFMEGERQLPISGAVRRGLRRFTSIVSTAATAASYSSSSLALVIIVIWRYRVASASNIVTVALRIRARAVPASILSSILCTVWSFRRDGDKHNRAVLTGLTAGVLAALIALTLSMCLVLSGAFTSAQCVAWTFDVLQSILMQVGCSGCLRARIIAVTITIALRYW